jgi:hypothetical protein
MATRRTISMTFSEFRRQADESVALRGVILVFGVLSIAAYPSASAGRASFEFRIGQKLRRGPANGCARADACALRG